MRRAWLGGEDIRKVKARHYIIAGAMLTVLFLLENAQVFGINGYIGYYPLYALKNAGWAALGVFILVLPRARFAGLIRLRGTVTTLALIFAFLYLLCSIAIGIFTEFARNTYSLNASGVALNLTGLAAVLFGGEFCRAFMIGNTPDRKKIWAVIGTGLLFALFYIPLGRALALSERLKVLDFISGTVLPEIALSIAASCLACLAGPVPAILYLGVIRAFGFLCPYIPNPERIPGLLFDVCVPLLSIWMISRMYTREAAEYDKRQEKDGITAGWLTTCVLSVLIVWFAVGIFPIYPSVILTGSMEPGIMPGDVVIVRKVGYEDVAVGDIIMYNNGEGTFITHRIIEKTDESGETLLVTKGDNNSGPDPGFVNASQLKGRVIYVVPDAGYATLLLRGLLNP